MDETENFVKFIKEKFYLFDAMGRKLQSFHKKENNDIIRANYQWRGAYNVCNS